VWGSCAPKPSTWSTTWAVWMQKVRRSPPRGRTDGLMVHRSPLRGRPPRRFRCRSCRTLPRGRPPGVSRCRYCIEPCYVGGKPGCGCIELPYVVDHQGHFDEKCAESRHVVDHLGRLDAGSASKSPRGRVSGLGAHRSPLRGRTLGRGRPLAALDVIAGTCSMRRRSLRLRPCRGQRDARGCRPSRTAGIPLGR
jgi:hypothetical protein